MLNPDRLKSLFFTDMYGGIRQAADVLEMSASSVSRQIARLEEEIGLTLIERHGRNVRLTEVGLALCEYYRNQRSADLQLQARMDEFRGMQRGMIRLSIGEGFSEWVVNNPLRAFQKHFPGITLDVMLHPTSESVRAILEDEADIGVTYFAPNDRHLKFHAKSDVPICAVVRREHPLTTLGRLPKLADVVSYPIALLHDDYGGRQITDIIARSENIVLRPALTSNSYRVARKFALIGDGVFIMPHRTSPQRELEDELVPLPLDYAATIPSQTQIITRADRYLTNSTLTLIRFMIDTGEFDSI